MVNYRYSKLTESAQKLRRQIKKKLIKSGTLSEVQTVKEKKAPIKAKVAKAAA